MEDLSQVKSEIVNCQFCNRQIERHELEEHTQFCSARIPQFNAGQRFITQKLNQNGFAPFNMNSLLFKPPIFKPNINQQQFQPNFQNSNQNSNFLQVQKEERTKLGQQLQQQNFQQNNINQSVLKSDEQEQMNNDLENLTRSQPIFTPNHQFQNLQPQKMNNQQQNPTPPFSNQQQQQNKSKIEFKPQSFKQEQQTNNFQYKSQPQSQVTPQFQPKRNLLPGNQQSIFSTEQLTEKKEKQNLDFLFTSQSIPQPIQQPQFQPISFSSNFQQQNNANQFQQQQKNKPPQQKDMSQQFQPNPLQQQSQIRLNPHQQFNPQIKPPQQQPPQQQPPQQQPQQQQFNNKFQPKPFNQFPQNNTSPFGSAYPQNSTQETTQSNQNQNTFNFRIQKNNNLFQNQPQQQSKFQNPQFQPQNPNRNQFQIPQPQQQQQQQAFQNPFNEQFNSYQRSPQQQNPQPPTINQGLYSFSRLNIPEIYPNWAANLRDTFSLRRRSLLDSDSESDSENDRQGLRNFDPEKEYTDAQVNRMTPEQLYEYFTIKDAKCQSGGYVQQFQLEQLGELVIPKQSEEQKEMCVICIEVLEEYDQRKTVQLVCKHLFHYDCIEKWLKRSKKCPLCKAFVDL